MIRTIVIGAAGRMGQLLVRQVLASPDLELAGATEIPGSPALGKDAGMLAGLAPCGVSVTEALEPLLDQADAVIDFSSPAGTMAAAPLVTGRGLTMVIGTTGLDAADRAELARIADAGARLVVAPNMSVGVNLLFYLCGKVAPILGEDYDIEVVEMHHNQKKDAPSGTAVRMAEILAQSVEMDYEQHARHGRHGDVGARPRREIGVHAVRGGDVVGDHTVVFAGPGERVELTHKASSRDTFAKGAVRAVTFLADAAPGLYDMQDVLGLRDEP